MGNKQVGASPQDPQLNNASYSTTYSQPLDPNVYGSAFGSSLTNPPPAHAAPPPSYPSVVVQQQPGVAAHADMTAAVSFLAANPQLCRSYAANVGHNPDFTQMLLQQNPEFAQALAQSQQMALILSQNNAAGLNAQYAVLLAAAGEKTDPGSLHELCPLTVAPKRDIAHVSSLDLGCCIGLLFAALFWEQFKDTVHTCPHCQRELGRYVPRGGGGGGRRGRRGRRRRRGGRR